MQRTTLSLSPVPTLEPADVPGFVVAMGAHDIRLLTGLDTAALADLLAARPPTRPVLRLDLAPPGTSEQIIERAIGQLAASVAELWPLL